MRLAYHRCEAIPANMAMNRGAFITSVSAQARAGPPQHVMLLEQQPSQARTPTDIAGSFLQLLDTSLSRFVEKRSKFNYFLVLPE